MLIHCLFVILFLSNLKPLAELIDIYFFMNKIIVLLYRRSIFLDRKSQGLG